MDTITQRSTYDQCVNMINLAVKETLEDQPEIEAGEDEIWCDMAAALLIDASRAVAEEVCRVQLGWIPIDLIRIWKLRDEAKAASSRAKAQAKAALKKSEKLAAEAAAEDAARQHIKDSTCPACFTVRTPAGNCNC